MITIGRWLWLWLSIFKQNQKKSISTIMILRKRKFTEDFSPKKTKKIPKSPSAQCQSTIELFFLLSQYMDGKFGFWAQRKKKWKFLISNHHVCLIINNNDFFFFFQNCTVLLMVAAYWMMTNFQSCTKRKKYIHHTKKQKTKDMIHWSSVHS